MFTGIVEATGRVSDDDGHRLRIESDVEFDGLAVGDSIAVDGCCLTATSFGDRWFTADVSDETRRRTRLSGSATGQTVNIERAVRLSDRLGGHIVQGHVDGVGEVLAPCPDLRIRIPEHLMRYVVMKGSITIDGVSLTVAELDGDEIGIAVIPHTADVTTLGERDPGDPVNVEVDVLAKYVERLVVAGRVEPSSSAPTGGGTR